jgi:hypothetical protein
MALSLDAAAEVFREAMRDTVKRYSLWYLIQGVLLIAAGVLAIIYPVLSSAAVVVLLGWLLIVSKLCCGSGRGSPFPGPAATRRRYCSIWEV